MPKPETASVVAVSLSPTHSFSKVPHEAVELVADHGVVGDAHAGATVRHRYARRKDPARPNLCQVHLIAAEFLDDLADVGYLVPAGGLGENVLTRGIDLLTLPEGTRLSLGPGAVLRLTGRRNPCSLIDDYRAGLRAHCYTDEDGSGRVGRVGVMAIVETGGTVRAGDAIVVELPPGEHRRLEYV